MDKTNKLLREVKDSKANLDQLNRLHTIFESNEKRNPGCNKLTFSVSGFSDFHAVCISEDIFFKVVSAAIEEESKRMANKFKTVEAIEMLSANQVGD